MNEFEVDLALVQEHLSAAEILAMRTRQDSTGNDTWLTGRSWERAVAQAAAGLR